MADADIADDGQNLEAPQEELDDEEQALLHISKYGEARRALPWERWTFREKANFYMDRIFLGLFLGFLLMSLGVFGYRMWYVTNLKKIAEFLSDSVIFLFDWLFTQDRQEELVEL